MNSILLLLAAMLILGLSPARADAVEISAVQTHGDWKSCLMTDEVTCARMFTEGERLTLALDHIPPMPFAPEGGYEIKFISNEAEPALVFRFPPPDEPVFLKAELRIDDLPPHAVTLHMSFDEWNGVFRVVDLYDDFLDEAMDGKRLTLTFLFKTRKPSPIHLSLRGFDDALLRCLQLVEEMQAREHADIPQGKQP